jgi:hypothetical protein
MSQAVLLGTILSLALLALGSLLLLLRPALAN